MADAWQVFQGWRPRVVVVDNAYFGEGSISVSGLLSGADLIRALRSLPAEIEDIVLPAGPFGFDGRATLDGVSAEEVGAAHPGRVHLASTPRELLAILRQRVGRAPRARQPPIGDQAERQIAEVGRLLDVDLAATEELQHRQKRGHDLVDGAAGHRPK